MCVFSPVSKLSVMLLYCLYFLNRGTGHGVKKKKSNDKF